MTVFWNFIAVTICVSLTLINNCDAGRFGFGRSRSRGGSYSRKSHWYSRPSSHSYPSYSHPSPSPSYSHPSHSPSYSRPSPSPSYSHPSPSHSYANHPASAPPSYHSAVNSNSHSSAPPSYSTISKGTSYSSNSHLPHAPPAYSPGGYSPQIPTAPKAPIAPPAYNPNYGWKVMPKNTETGTGNVVQKPYTQQNSGYGRLSPKPVGPVGPVGIAPAATISATKNSQTFSSNPAHNSGINNGLNYPRQQYTQPNQNSLPSFNNQNHFSSPPHQPTVVNNFVTNNHHSNFQAPSYSPAPYHFVSYNHYPSTYYSPFRDYYPISLGLHLYSGSHLGYGGYHDHHHYYHHTYSNSPAATATNSNTAPTMGNTNSNPSNSGPNQNSNNIPNAVGSYQNGTTNDGITHKPDPFERSQPLIYTIPAEKKGDDDDSTEIIFTNPYLIVGVENLLFYGEFHDDEDTTIFIDQGSDGLEPVEPSQQPNYNADANLTSSTTAANNDTIILGATTTLASLTETTTDNQKQEMATTEAPNSGTLSINTTSQPILSTSTGLPRKLDTIEE